jgi:hypothetical protein
MPLKKFGQIIGTRPEQFERFKTFYLCIWPNLVFHLD